MNREQEAYDKAYKDIHPEINPSKINYTLDELLERKMISHRDFEIYNLFELNEFGKKYIKQLIEEDYSNVYSLDIQALAYKEGKRDMLRSIKATISRINHLLKGEHQDDR